MPTPLETPNAETRTTFIYALCEPGTRTVRYVGKADNPKKRLAGHLKYAKTGKRVPVTCWLFKLLKDGQRPDMHVLREVPQDEWKTYERAFIAVGRQHGLRLLNLSDGGDGFESGEKNLMFGKKRSAESCAKQSASISGEKHPWFGRKHTPESIAKMRAYRLGKKASMAARLKMRVTRKWLLQGLKHPGASSKFIGVSREAEYRKLWRGQVNESGKRVCVGRFLVEEEAALAVDLANKRIYGEKAKLNFPNGQ